MLFTIILIIFSFQQLAEAGYCAKKGVAHGWRQFRCGDFDVLNSYSWWYSWSCDAAKWHANHGCTSEIDDMFADKFVPMIWGVFPKTDYTCHHGTNATDVLGANEPNHAKQSRVNPTVAAQAWPLLQNNATGLLKGTPSAANCGGDACFQGYNTTAWYDEFFNNCAGCEFDFLATHHYSCNATKTMEYLEMLHNRYNLPIWLTEFACRTEHNNVTKVLEYMQDVLPRLDSAAYVHRYAWFGTRINDDSKWLKTSASLFYPTNDTLTPLGEVYDNWSC